MATAITVQNKEKIFDAIRKGDKPYWEISVPTKSNVAGQYNVITSNSELDDVNDSIEAMREALDGVMGLLLIRISNKPFPHSKGNDTSRQTLQFYYEQSKYAAPEKTPVRGTEDVRDRNADKTMNDRMFSVYDQLSEVKAERTGLKYEIASKDREIAELKRIVQEKEDELNECYTEIDELKEAELNRPVEPVSGVPQEDFWIGAAKEFLPLIKPHIGSIVGNVLSSFNTNKNNPVILNGMEGEAKAEPLTEKEREEKTMAALWRLAKVDANLDDTLTMLATFAEKKPEDYRAYCNMLSKMS